MGLPRYSRLAGSVVAGALLMSVAPPAVAVDAETASRQISERYAVEVLRVRPGEIDDREVWFITVMQPGGNSNSAFQVHVLAVDQESGALVPSYRHGIHGATLPPPAPGGSPP